MRSNDLDQKGTGLFVEQLYSLHVDWTIRMHEDRATEIVVILETTDCRDRSHIKEVAIIQQVDSEEPVII
jgi:hypothetical protein